VDYWQTQLSETQRAPKLDEMSIKRRQHADSSQIDDSSQTILGHMIRHALTIEGALYAPEAVCDQMPSN